MGTSFLGDGDFVGLAVHGRRGGEDDAAPAGLPHPLQELQAADQVVAVIALGMDNRFPHLRISRQVNDRGEGAALLAQPCQCLTIGEIGHHQGHVAHGGTVPGGEVVNHHQIMSRRLQAPDHMRTHIPRSAGDQNSHAHPSRCGP